jgi:hypothetical protein
MRNKYVSYLYLLGIILLTSCSGPKEGEVSISSPTPKESVSLPSQLSSEIEQIQFSCDDDQCPNYTGLVVAGQGEQTWRCTGFLINQTTLMTALHCLPPALRAIDQSCNGHLEFILPETANSAQERLKCDKVIGLNTMQWRPHDFVVLKLQEQPLRSLQSIRLNQDSRYHAQVVNLWRIQSLSSEQVRLNSTRCQLNNQSLLSLYFDSPQSSMIQYSDCQTYQGHSGGPLFNLQGEIIGLHSSSIKETSVVSQSFAGHTAQGLVEEVSLATNIGCICRSGEYWRPCTTPASCLKTYSDEEMLQQRLRILDRTIRPFDQRRQIPPLENLRLDLIDDYFDWEYSLSYTQNQSQTRFFTTLRPRCLKRQFQVNDLPWRTGPKLVYPDHLFCETRVELSPDLSVRNLTIPTSMQCQHSRIELQTQGDQGLTLKMTHQMNNGLIEEIIPIEWCTF